MTVTGPLGWWKFPILSRILSLLDRDRGSDILPLQQPVVINEEKITFQDWKGRTRDMTIKREVRTE